MKISLKASTLLKVYSGNLWEGATERWLDKSSIL